MMKAETFRQLYTNLTCVYIDRYVANEEQFLTFICDSIIPKRVLLETYQYMIKDKVLEPIESLPLPEKEAIFSKFKKTGIIASKEQAIESCAVIHTLDFLSKNI